MHISISCKPSAGEVPILDVLASHWSEACYFLPIARIAKEDIPLEHLDIDSSWSKASFDGPHWPSHSGPAQKIYSRLLVIGDHRRLQVKAHPTVAPVGDPMSSGSTIVLGWG